jgi:hypothetical protein
MVSWKLIYNTITSRRFVVAQGFNTFVKCTFVKTPIHVLHLGFLKRLLGVKKGTDSYCVLRETGQMPFFSIGSDASYVSGTVTLLKQSSF